MSETYDVVIIGAGIAGASLAYRLAGRGITDVAVLEQAPTPGYHATGRSAAVFLTYSADPFEQRAVAAARPFLAAPPDGFGEILRATGVILAFDEPGWASAQQHATALAALGVAIERVTPRQLDALMPIAPADGLAGAIYLPEDGRLDVPALLRGYLDHARARGATLRCGQRVSQVLTTGSRCTGVVTEQGPITARWVVNAAGAWAGAIGQLAGATPIPLQPYRRTVITFAPPAGLIVRDWPMICYESRAIYVAPEADGLLACPMDEDPVEPQDARPDPAMIAEARARVAAVAPSLAPDAVQTSRAGLRTFAPDRQLVVGEDPALKGFFWLAGQGGWGIEGSPIVSQIAADLLATGETSWLDVAAIAPDRFAPASR